MNLFLCVRATICWRVSVHSFLKQSTARRQDFDHLRAAADLRTEIENFEESRAMNIRGIIFSLFPQK